MKGVAFIDCRIPTVPSRRAAPSQPDAMEFLYTRQQMEGFKGYQSKVKIGNWSEDMELEAAKLKTYLLKKDRGALKCSQVRSAIAALSLPTQSSPGRKPLCTPLAPPPPDV